jgi:hypothetical protein
MEAGRWKMEAKAIQSRGLGILTPDARKSTEFTGEGNFFAFSETPEKAKESVLLAAGTQSSIYAAGRQAIGMIQMVVIRAFREIPCLPCQNPHALPLALSRLTTCTP